MRSGRFLAPLVAGLCVLVVPAGVASAASAASAVESCRAQGASPYDPPRLSADGSVVVFTTKAALVPNDTNRTLDVYARHLPTGAVELVSVGSTGEAGSGRSGSSAVSADGRLVAFQSDARLTPGDDQRGQTDVFLRNRQAGTTQLVSVRADGQSGTGASSRPDLSPDGSRVAFESMAADLVAGDSDGLSDVFVRDVAAGTTVRVSALPDGRAADQLGSHSASISGIGKVAFQTTEFFFDQPSDLLNAREFLRDSAAYLRNIVVRDPASGDLELASVAADGGPQDGLSYRPEISDDGRFVTFESSSTDLVEGDTNNSPDIRGLFQTDIFVRDLQAAATSRVNVASDGTQADGNGSSGPAISGDGGRVVFESGATNLVEGDTGGVLDVFVHHRAGGATTRASVDATGGDPGSAGYLSFGSVSGSLSSDGRWVAFLSSAPGLVGDVGQTHGPPAFGVFVRSLESPGVLSGPFGVGCDGAPPLEAVVAVDATVSSAAGGAGAAGGGSGLGRGAGSSAPAGGVSPDLVPAASRSDGPRGWVGLAAIGLGGLVLVALGAGFGRRGKGRRARRPAVVAAIGLALAASSFAAGAHHYSPIQPGGAVLEEPPASLNFVFRDHATGDLYVGTAAHAVREYGIGDRPPIAGFGQFGTLVYSREGQNAFSRQDFALIKVDADKHGLVDPSVRTWGGPTGVADPRQLLPGLPTFQYGQGAFFRHNQTTRAKRGVFQRAIDDDWGYLGWYLRSDWSFGGDSGSPVLVGADGQALGVVIAIAAGYSEPGESMGPTAYLIRQELDLAGFNLQLVTAPFHGIGGDLRTVEHCAAKPVEEGPHNDGCMSPTPAP